MSNRKRISDNKCCQCGMCCLSANCAVSQRIFNIPEKTEEQCPALRWNEDNTARCAIAVSTQMKTELGIGVGCCISARCYSKGVYVGQFESLSAEKKLASVAAIKKRYYLSESCFKF